MVEVTDEDYDAAVRRGAADMATVPRARAARYVARGQRLVIDLANGASFSVPVRLLQGMATAPARLIAQVELSPAGFGLHWEELDADFSVAGLLASRFGTAHYMRERFGGDQQVEAAE